MIDRNSNQFELTLKGYRLATAEILYHMPDYPDLLQSFIWQHYDIAPDYPTLTKFLDFWTDNIEGPIHSVRVARHDLIQSNEAHFVDFSYTLH